MKSFPLRLRQTVEIVAVFLFAGCSRGRVERLEWTTMGTVAAVQMRGATSEQATATRATVKACFAQIEALLNAHDPNSELSRLAPLSREEILKRCDPLVRPCYEAAFAWSERTGGAFNPRWRGPEKLDLGAIAKGFAADVAGRRLGRKLPFDVLIDIGGNLLAVRGDWKVGVAGCDERFALKEGEACATSAEYFRGKHIYDGRTGRPVTNDVRSVTVVATDAMSADLFSTTAFIFGPEKSKAPLDNERTRSVLWVLKDGRKTLSVRNKK